MFRSFRSTDSSPSAHHNLIPASSASQSNNSPHTVLLRTARTPSEPTTAVTTALRHLLAATRSIPEVDIDMAKPVYAYGVDSLVAVEMRQWFWGKVGAEVGVVHVFESGSVEGLARVVVGRKVGVGKGDG